MQTPIAPTTADTGLKDVLAVFGFLGGFLLLLFAVEPLPSISFVKAVQEMMDGKLSAKEATAVVTVAYLTIPLTLTVIVAALWAEHKTRTNAQGSDDDKWVLLGIVVGGFLVGNWLALALGSIVVPVLITTDLSHIHGGPIDYIILFVILVLVSSYLSAYGAVLAFASVIVGLASAWALVRLKVV